MKIFVTSGCVFAPGVVPTLDVSGAVDADGHAVAVTPGTLLAVLNASHPGTVFAAGKAGLGAHWSGAVLALQASTLGMMSTDQLVLVVEDGSVGARDRTLSTGIVQAHADAQAALAVLDTLATSINVQAVTDKLEQVRAAIQGQAVYWHEARAVTGSTPIVGASRASGGFGAFEAVVSSVAGGTLKIVNEDAPALTISMLVKPGQVAALRAPAFGSSFHAEFAPAAADTVTLSNGYIKDRA